MSLRGQPTIGDRVRIGAGAKLLGPISIGDDAVIGANAVILGDVAAGASVNGVWKGPSGDPERESADTLGRD